MKRAVNGVLVDMTAEEISAKEAEDKIWTDGAKDRKLAEIKALRLERLKETDFYALQDVSMSNEMKTWRQSLRDIPANYTTEEAYDLLLARNPDTKELTHSVWSKP